MGGDTGASARVIEVRADSDEAVPQPKDAKTNADSGSGKAAGNGSANAGKPADGQPSQTKAATSKPAAADNAEKPASKPGAPAGAAAAPPVQSKPPSRPASRGGEGLGDEMLTQIAQAKFEAQEERLRDVARQSMALLRDYQKMPAADCERRVAEVRKSLLKYEMQYIRAWASQERRRRLETEVLEAEAERCRQEAEEEGEKIVELRQILERERRRRKRYEHYEKLAEEVNRKKSRTESQTEIDQVTAEIERVKRKRAELEALAEERNQRGQLLRHAVAELKQDLQREQKLSGEVVGGGGRSAGDKAAQQAAPQPSAGTDVEVIS